MEVEIPRCLNYPAAHLCLTVRRLTLAARLEDLGIMRHSASPGRFEFEVLAKLIDKTREGPPIAKKRSEDISHIGACLEWDQNGHDGPELSALGR